MLNMHRVLFNCALLLINSWAAAVSFERGKPRTGFVTSLSVLSTEQEAYISADTNLSGEEVDLYSRIKLHRERRI